MPSLRHVLRRLGRTPGFTAIAVLTLALGIGANTAIFSVVNGVLLKPLSFPDADSLVNVGHVAPGVPGVTTLSCAPTMYFTYREQNHTFAQFGVWTILGVSITHVEQPERVFAAQVTSGTLDALGVQPILGRRFSDADTAPGAPLSVILTYGYWQRAMGGDPSVLGRTVTIDNQQRAVIGVLPQDFRFLANNPQLFVPLQFDRAKLTLGDFSYQGIARLKPRVTLEQANADVARMLPLWMDSWPPPAGGFPMEAFRSARFGADLKPLKSIIVGNIGDSLWVLMAAIGVLLLIACANIANLLLVRAEGRQHEFAVRAALGASRGRIAREMLLESLLLGISGGAIGLVLADAAVRALIAAAPANLPRLTEISVDGRVSLFTVGVSLISALVFGLAPIWKHARPRLGSALRVGGRSLSGSREHNQARNTLVVTQVALAMVLLVGSGLMIRTFQALRAVNPGFAHAEEIQLVRVALPESLIPQPERVAQTFEAMRDKIAGLPGVSQVSFSASVPMDGMNSNDVFVFQEKPLPAGRLPPNRRRGYISPGFLGVFSTPLVAGREFTQQDLRPDRDVMIVSQNLAIEVFGSPEAAVGRHMRELANDPWAEIVGVVADVHDQSIVEPAGTIVYMPAFTRPNAYRPGIVRSPVFAIRSTRVGTDSFLKEGRQAIWSVQPDLPVFGTRIMQELYDQSLQRTSFTLVLLGIAGGMALLLGIIGIYGVISYAVSQRTREIGIRVALGAEPASLQAMFVRHGLVLAAVGIGIGVAAAAGLTRWMTSILFGVQPLDPLTFAAVPAVLALAVALASYIPARRVSKADPMQALRAD